jgi:periplasmic divalent cation tolerance protein
MPAARFIVVLTAVDKRRLAQRIADVLVEQHLAACVQISGPVTSTYLWQGKMEKTREYLVLAKTTRAHYPAVEKAIKALHTYQVPEILALPVAAGGKDYLAWLADSLRS